MFGVDNWGIDAIGRLGGAIAASGFAGMEEMRSNVEQRLKKRYNRLMEHYERERELGRCCAWAIAYGWNVAIYAIRRPNWGTKWTVHIRWRAI